jgi:hypothetical protein
MKYDLVIKEEAIVDMQQAYDYYEEHKTGLGERFLNTLEEYLGRVRKNPLHYQIKRKPYREVFIKHFPYLIIYEIVDSSIIVYAIFNTSLNP